MTYLSATHRRHLDSLRGRPAIIDCEGLRIGTQYTMFFAEADLMRLHAQHLLDGMAQADVLEVGLGLGVFATVAAEIGVGSYTAIEAHPGAARLARQRVLPAFDDRATLHVGPWQTTELTGVFDAIMYDTWPPDGYADPDFAIFVEHVALPRLRPGGRFSFFHSGTRLSPARSAVLDELFTDWTTHPYTMPTELTPAHWTKPSRDFLIPIARKGDT